MTSTEKGKSLVEKGLDGTGHLTSQDVHSYVGDYIRENNTKNLQKTECAIDKTSLDFNLGGRPCPVVDFNEQKFQFDTFSLTNNGKKTVYFNIFCADIRKFDLEITPNEGEIKKGKSQKVELKLRCFCTTKVYPIMKITLSHIKPKEIKEKKKVLKPGEKKEITAPIGKTDELGVLLLCFKIESDLSTSLDFDELVLGTKIGEGGYGTVYKGTWRGNECAIKILENEDLVDDEREMVKRELELLGKLTSPYVVTYMGSTIVPGQRLALVMEYVKDGSLSDILKKNDDFDNKFRCKLALDVAKGMTFLHSNNVYHRDIKPDNMLVISPHRNTQINLKITDFGTSRNTAKKSNTSSDYLSFTDIKKDQKKNEIAKKNEPKKPSVPDLKPKDSRAEFRLTKGVGTLIYQAPELLSGKADYAIDKTDIYSFGVLLWQVFTGKEPYSEPPYNNMNTFAIIDFVTNGKRIEIPKSIPKKIRALIEKCWDHDPQSRPTFSQICKDLEDIMGELDEEEHSEPVSSNPKFDVPIPSGGNGVLASIGWNGSIDRNRSEELLKNSPPQTFLVRWSHNTRSYVLSYTTDKRDPKARYQHIAYIRPNKNGSITVDKQDGSVSNYDSLVAYIDAMKQSGIIRHPFAAQEDLYERSPGIKN